MFILTLVLVSWSSFVFVIALLGLAYKTSCGVESASLTRAEIIVPPSPSRPSSVTHDVMASSADVTLEIEHLMRSRNSDVNLLPRLLTFPVTDDVRRLLTDVISQYPSHLRPVCFLDLRYSTRRRGTENLFRCVCPIFAFSDRVRLPTCIRKATTTDMTNATLTLRCDGDPCRQWTCNVTSKVRPLRGPAGDFHRHEYPGNQLTRPILRLVLADEIQTLMTSFHETCPELSSYARSESTNSLKSTGGISDDAHDFPRTSVSVRIHFHCHRNEVIKL